MKPPLYRTASRIALAAACVLGMAACADRGQPLGADPAAAAPRPLPMLTGALKCTAEVATRKVSCREGNLPSSARGYIIVGGQHQYVELTSSNVSQVGTAFTFDVTVQNLIAQPMGTADGTTVDSSGVRIVFASGPDVTGGTGNVVVANADGVDAFTTSNQPYFAYTGTALGADSILSTNETSTAKNWNLTVDAGVTSFTFQLWVVAEVPEPAGYIDVAGGGFVLNGNTLALSDSVRTAVGDVDSTAVVTWTTGDSTVATVDNAGVVTGVGVGSTTITATSGLRTGTASVKVCPNLAVGGAYTAVMPGASNVCFGGYAGTSEFTYMPVNLSTSSALSLTLTGTGIQAVTGPPSPVRLPGTSLLRLPSEELNILSDIPYLERDAAKMNALMGDRDSRIRSGRRSSSGVRRIITQGVVPTVGDSMDLNTNSACSGTPSNRRGVVRSVSQHLVIVADTANPAGGFTTAQYDSIALEFDTIAWPVDSANFGPPTDEDGNGRVVAFYTRAVNELSPPASSSVVLGFFASKDVFSNDPVDGCTNSNMGEMFYMLVPDPTGAVNSNVRTVSFVRGSTVGTLGHEFQHMINAFRRAYVTGASFFEQGYLNEGLSHIAEELMFYRTSVGLAPRQNIQLSTLTTGPNASRRVAAFNTYANQNFGRFRSWLQRPDTAGAFRPNANSLAVRGAIWGFLRYAADRVNGNDQTFWYNMVNSNLEGKANIQNAIGGANNPDAWVRDFNAAMYADDNAFSVAAAYQNPSWNFRSVYGGLGGFPLGTRPLSNGVGLTLSYASGASTAYARFGVAASSFSTVTALSGGVAPSSPYALIVVRTK